MRKNTEILENYLTKIFEKARSNVREESYYPILENLLNEAAVANKKKIQVDSFPKKTEAGNPDIRVLNGEGRLIGYIEAKAPASESLETIENSEQLKRYRATFPNLILTNFLEFRLYRDGQLTGKPVAISSPHPFLTYKFDNVPVQNKDVLLTLFEQFFAFSIPRIYTPKALAVELAKRTRFLRDEIITNELKKEESEQKGRIWGFYKAFQEYLIASLTRKDFANLYAQTITYGLFIARHRFETLPNLFEGKPAGQPFTRELAYKFIQPSLGILREVFHFISSAEPPTALKWAVDDIAEVLAAADLQKVVAAFHKEDKGRDPIIHFYETFLAEYDPKEREKRGVYYTPEPVVSYITRSIHHLLKEKFNKEDGFADASVTVLDPAAGTLTFPAQAINLAVNEYREKYGSGGVKKLIKNHILPNFYAFELMMAPYAVGHLKIDFLLEKLGYKLENDERFNLFLTNTLELKDLERSQLPGLETLSEESQKAGEVKREIPIMVIVGNPPYSGVSENKGEWITEKIEDYKKIEDKSLGEKKYWLQDDYVKFFRFAQWKIEQAGAGILGFITNHAWLDNPTFRGMRYSLMKTFDEIYIVNLHGSTLKKEKTPDGGKDENVFDIRPGVAIAICIKRRLKRPMVTLDTCCIEIKREEELKTIEQLERLGKIQVYISTVTEREMRKDTRGAKKTETKEKDQEIAVWNESEWGSSTWGEDNYVLEKIIEICFAGFPKIGQRENLSRGYKKQLRDAMILEGHIRNNRDIFVTENSNDFIKDGKREKLQSAFEVKICTPEELLNEYSLCILYTNLWGLREEKYDWLKNHDVTNTKWQKVSPSKPYYFFVPVEKAGWDLYEKFWKVTDIFPVNSTGVATNRDAFVTDHSRKELEVRIRMFRNSPDSDDFIKQALTLNENYAWRVSNARRQLQDVSDWENYFIQYQYRPFDKKWVYFHPSVVWRTRENTMQHMLSINLALCVGRAGAVTGSKIWDIVFASDSITDLNLFRRGGNQFFPLYLYSETQTAGKKKNPGVAVMMLFDKPKEGYKVKRPNINLELHALLNNTYNPQRVATDDVVLGKRPDFCLSPEEIFYYIYAVLYSNTYRQKYQEFLKIDFPKVPFTKDYKLFQKLAKLGEQLVELHLLKSKELEKPIAKFQGRNENMVEKREYKNGRVYINDTQYFEGIKPEVWEYQIGGYQVLDKWLKDRKGRALSAEDIKHYCKVVTVLAKTIELQKQIDKSYPKVEQTLI